MSLLTRRSRRSTTETIPAKAATERHPAPAAASPSTEGCGRIADVRWRQSVRVAGRVRSIRVQPWADVPALECTLVDATGGITVVFLGRRKVGGVQPGSRMMVEGVVGDHHEKLAMLNPDYTLLEG